MVDAIDTTSGAFAQGGQRCVLVTGGAGYIGSLLVRRLLDRGYHVRVLEGFLYGDDALRSVLGHPRLQLVIADFRNEAAVEEAVAEVDAVIHLGAVVGDTPCALDPRFTTEVNEEGTRTIASVCSRLGVKRLLFASSCSVYGASDELLDENSALNPLSHYAQTKLASERMLLAWPDRELAPIILRFATVYGLSARPRFDLAVNVLTAKAHCEGRIVVHGGGDQWRPFIHVDDIGRALVLALEAPIETVARKVFNVGSDAQNHRLREIGDLIQEIMPRTTIGTDAISDRRNYRVSFAKIRETLGFEPSWDLRSAILELKAGLEQGVISDFRDPQFDNYQYLRDGLAVGLDSLLLREGCGAQGWSHRQDHVAAELPTVIRWSERWAGTPRPWRDQLGHQPLVAAMAESPGD